MSTTDTSPSASRPVANGSPSRLGGSAIAVILVITAAFSNQLGAALGVQLFRRSGRSPSCPCA